MIRANQQTTTIDTWPYYEFEDFINILNKKNEEEAKTREEEEKKQNKNSDYGNILKNAQNFKPPNFKPPKF